jgi:hypothetical protein
MTSNKAKTAAEFLAELEANPEWRAQRDRHEQQRRENHERILAAQRPLVDDLRAAGTRVESVWDLVNTRARYPAAIPVLLEHLERDYIPEVREGIARALAVPEAHSAWPRLLELFKREPARLRRDVKWALAVAVAGTTTEAEVDTIMELVRDPSQGKYRLAWLRPLRRSGNPAARKTLEDLREDPDLRKELRVLLGRPRKRP